MRAADYGTISSTTILGGHDGYCRVTERGYDRAGMRSQVTREEICDRKKEMTSKIKELDQFQ